jgi:hypothetical protein
MRLIETSSVDIALKCPELESGRALPLGMFEQFPSDAVACQGGIDVELIDPFVVQHHQGDDLAAVVNDPDLTSRQDDFFEPLAYVLITVDRRRDRWN